MERDGGTKGFYRRQPGIFWQLVFFKPLSECRSDTGARKL
jgi:hypothetical protein